MKRIQIIKQHTDVDIASVSSARLDRIIKACRMIYQQGVVRTKMKVLNAEVSELDSGVLIEIGKTRYFCKTVEEGGVYHMASTRSSEAVDASDKFYEIIKDLEKIVLATVSVNAGM